MLRVLTYHRVDDAPRTPALDPKLVSAAPRVFERHMEHLARHYRVVAADDVLAAFHGDGALPRRAVLITFDDAYRDFTDVAWPILRRFGFPVTLFVPTGLPDRAGRAFWWDRIHRALTTTRLTTLHGVLSEPLPLGSADNRRAASRRIRALVKTLPHADAMALVDRVCQTAGVENGADSHVLSWNDLRRLVRDGVTVGSHTRTHPMLTRVPPETAWDEIARSADDLERELGRRPLSFSYPLGGHDDRIVAMVADAGFRLAFTQRDGHNAPSSTHPLRLRRTNITRRTSPRVFPLRLLPWFAHIDRWRHRSRSGAAS